MRHRPIRSSRTLVLMTGLVLLLGALSAVSRPAQAQRTPLERELRADRTFIASLDPVEGLVQHQPPERDAVAMLQWDNATEVVLVSEGDRIRTDANGYAYLTFFEGLETEIGPDTLVVVSTLEIPPAGQEGRFDVTLDVLVGNTLSNVQTLLDAEDRFEIHTPGATAVVRGTQWYTLVQPNGESIFSALEDTVFIFPHILGQPGTPPPQLGDLIPLMPGFSLFVNNMGEAGEPYEGMDAQFGGPQGGPLAPATCGNLVCEAGEEDICAVDCLPEGGLPDCGDAICDREAGEGLLTCAQDCGPYQGAECGNGVCDRDESGLSCPADCRPDEYLSPVNDVWCGNGVCDITESALTCLDCRAQEQDLGLLCVLSAAGEPVRTGPALSFPASFILGAGTPLTAVGINANGTWFAVDQNGQRLWINAAAVRAEGACGGLPIVASPPLPPTQPPLVQPTAPPQPTLTPTTTAPGTWLGCGSCDTCGYPAGECVTAPDGQCLWDPNTCRRAEPTEPPTTEPEPTQEPRLTVASSSYTCRYYFDQAIQVEATYHQVDDATIAEYGASSNEFGVDTYPAGPTQFGINVYCGFQSESPESGIVTATALDTQGRQVGTSFQVVVDYTD